MLKLLLPTDTEQVTFCIYLVVFLHILLEWNVLNRFNDIFFQVDNDQTQMHL